MQREREQSVVRSVHAGMTFVIFGYRRSCVQTRLVVVVVVVVVSARALFTHIALDTQARVSSNTQPTKRVAQECVMSTLMQYQRNKYKNPPHPVDEHSDLSY